MEKGSASVSMKYTLYDAKEFSHITQNNFVKPVSKG